MYRSTCHQRIITDLTGLRDYVQTCQREAELYQIGTMDCEGEDDVFPTLLLTQFVGAHPVIIHLLEMEKRSTRDDIKDELAGLIEVLASEHVVLIGSRIHKDTEQLEKYFPVKFKNTFDLEPLLRFALDIGVYAREIVRFFFGNEPERRRVFLRSSLGWIAFAEVGYNYKPFSYKNFRKHGTDAEWKEFDRDRKILPSANHRSLYHFNRPLTNKQRLYLQYDCVVPLRLLFSVARQSIEDCVTEKVGKNITLKKRLFRVLKCAFEEDGFRYPKPGILTAPVEEIVEVEEVEWLEETAGPGQKESSVEMSDPGPVMHENVSISSISEQEHAIPTFLTDTELDRQLKMREMMAGEPHSLDVTKCDVSRRERYRNPDFQFRKRTDRDMSRVTKAMGKYETTEQYKACNHRSHRPLLTRFRCHHCGLKHENEADLCPLFQYHQGKHILWEHRSVFQSFPCLYCDQGDHVLRMCGEMHSYCGLCHIRGHKYYARDRINFPSHPKQDRVDLLKDRFVQYAEFGHRTSKARGETFHRWGYTVHPKHRCERREDNFSDSGEDEPPSVEERLKLMQFGI